jgi:hypothetical protein
MDALQSPIGLYIAKPTALKPLKCQPIGFNMTHPPPHIHISMLYYKSLHISFHIVSTCMAWQKVTSKAASVRTSIGLV